MLEIFFLGRGAPELTGSFIFGSQIPRANRGTSFEKIKTPLRKMLSLLTNSKEEKQLQFYPTRPVWSLFMPGKVCFPQSEPIAATSSHLGLAEPREVSLCCVARMLL